jgi:endonuclease YncB( thermonuclease family)
LRRLIDFLVAYALIGALVVIAVELNRRPAESLHAAGAAVIDGDTLWIDGERLRLLDIDAPELDQTCDIGGERVACGRQAREALRALIAPDLECETHGHDLYGRRLARCHTGQGDLAARLVRAGYAVAEGCCRAEEESARNERRGIWAGRFDRPAEWRRAHAAGARS